MRRTAVFAFALLFPLAGCAVRPMAEQPVLQTQGPYLLDTGDTVRVTVYGDEQLSDTYRIDDGGAVAFPLVGSVKVRGQTTKAAAARIEAALANGFMRDPDVAVEVAEYRPFFIEGGVKNAGQFPYVYGMTVRTAVATAGGLSQNTSRGKAIIYRTIGGQLMKAMVDFDSPIQPGDTVVVSETWRQPVR